MVPNTIIVTDIGIQYWYLNGQTLEAPNEESRAEPNTEVSKPLVLYP